MKRFTIFFKLTSLILVCAFLTVAAIGVYNYEYSRSIILKNAETNSRHLARETAWQIDSTLALVQKVADNIAISLEKADLSEEGLNALTYQVLAHTPEIFGMAIAFEPYFYDNTRLYFSPYQSRSAGRIVRSELGSDEYRYFYMDWYQLPKELEHSVWTEPYMDEGGGNALMATYSVPFYRTVDGERVFAGVVTADISLSWLQKLIEDIHIFETGYAFLLSRYGTFITHPDRDVIMNQTIFSMAEERGSSELREIGRQMRSENSRFVKLAGSVLGEDRYLFHTRLSNGGWSLGVVFPEAEMFADINRLTTTMIVIGLAGFLVLALVVTYIARHITTPLTKLSGAAQELAGGNLDLEMPAIDTRDEVGDLADSFQTMRLSLKEYIADLTSATAAKERIESELKIARVIQANFLPKRFPPFPERTEFDIFAKLTPAREVGGDLFDFFILDDRYLFVSVGDVSDKGVPAALFMAVTKTLMKGIAEHQRDPAEVLMRVNDELASDNDTCMFVTLFCGILDLKTGELVYSNAGHDAPLLLRAGNEVCGIDVPPGLVLGAMPGAPYQCGRMTLEPDDRLVLFTDGITEAMSTEQELFGMERLMESAARGAHASADDLSAMVLADLERHTKGAAQSDDITLMALHWHGPKS